MTPQLRQAIKILQVSRAELETLDRRGARRRTRCSRRGRADKPDATLEPDEPTRRRSARGRPSRHRKPSRARGGQRQRSQGDRLEGVPRELQQRLPRRRARRSRARRRPAAGAREHARQAQRRSPTISMWQLRLSDLDARGGAGDRGADHRQPRQRRLSRAAASRRSPSSRTAAGHRGGRARAAPRPGVRSAGRRARAICASACCIQLRQLGSRATRSPARIVRDHLGAAREPALRQARHASSGFRSSRSPTHRR